MKRNYQLFIEFLSLFVLLPTGLLLPVPILLKITAVGIGVLYVIKNLIKLDNAKFTIKKEIHWILFWKRTTILFIIIACITIAYVWFTKPEALFYVPLHKPVLFFGILAVYSIFSVWPQEVIYRTFFFERYQVLFINKYLLLIVNAFVFSVAHLFFKNTLVLVFTFIGALLFGFTYLKYKSTTLVTIEHALYGNWLFTVGMGEMLAFPGMEN